MFIGSCIHEYRGPVQANYPRGTQLFYAGYRAGPYEMIKSNVIWERVYMSFVVLLFILVGVLLSLSEARECCKCS